MQAFKIRAHRCGQVYRVATAETPSGKRLRFYPPGTSQAVTVCIKCGDPLPEKSMATLKKIVTRARLADFTGTPKDFAKGAGE